MITLEIIMVVLLVLMVAVAMYCLVWREKTEAEDAWAIINELREDGWVLIRGANENAVPIEEQNCIDCTGGWTDWESRSFYGRTVLEALKKALQAKGEASAEQFRYNCRKCGGRFADPETLGNPFMCPQCNITLTTDPAKGEAK